VCGREPPGDAAGKIDGRLKGLDDKVRGVCVCVCVCLCVCVCIEREGQVGCVYVTQPLACLMLMCLRSVCSKCVCVLCVVVDVLCERREGLTHTHTNTRTDQGPGG
jgi:hypothetical protein